MPHDFLQAALAERLRQGPAQWDMILTIGEPGDAEDDPTILWPPDRKEVKVGTLAIASVAPERQAGSYSINFDPLMLDDGIAATNDPVLLFRSSSYAISHTRRLQKV
jgi:catalase